MKTATCVFTIGLLLGGVAQGSNSTPPAADGPQPEALKKWQEMRFGMFIHWGPVSLTGKEIGWSRGAGTPAAEYDALYQQFNPVNFNADEWVQAAKDAGMKYMILTTKHHDGFCLWNTKETPYNIMNTPFKRDVVKELSAACKKQGIAFGTYYSVTDWYQSDWPVTSPGGNVKREKYDLDAYEKYLQNQITELITQYGPLLTIWNDMPVMYGKERGLRTIQLLRKLQPDILVNDRTGAGGDYATPEQKIGGFNMVRPWESCMTLSAHNHWAWGGEKDGVKALAPCLSMLIRGAGGDGNVLLNVGPRPDGKIDEQQVNRLKEIGVWLQKNGESIYGTRGGPFKPAPWGVSTRKGNTIYVHVTKWDGERVALPALPAKIELAKLLSGADVEFQQTGKNVVLNVPGASQDSVDTIVALTVNMPAIDIAPIDTGK